MGDMKSLLICTDLDRTLLPNGKAVESPMARRYFSHLIEVSHAQLVYVSGRSLPLVKSAIQQYSLPKPHYIIADVGTSIYQPFNDTWQPLIQWQQHLTQLWSDTQATYIKRLLKDFPVLHLQANDQQTIYKVSYCINLVISSTVLLENIQQCLQQHNIQANLIYSIDDINGIALLDIVPPLASKYHAIQFLRKQQNILLTHTVFAGDSGNDLSVLVSEIPSILVNNADNHLKQEILSLSCSRKQAHRLYIAQGNFLGMNGNYAAGIVEGLLHFHPELMRIPFAKLT